MGRPLLVNDLPPAVFEELKQRLLDYGFTGYQLHSDWLAGKGYSISKSSLIRFGRSIELGFSADLRMKCAAIAAHYSTADNIIENATAVMRWIKPPMN